MNELEAFFFPRATRSLVLIRRLALINKARYSNTIGFGRSIPACGNNVFRGPDSRAY